MLYLQFNRSLSGVLIAKNLPPLGGGQEVLTLMRRACFRSVNCAAGVEVQGLAAVAHA
jgi:hypothetical protein